MQNNKPCNIQTYNELKSTFSQFAMLCEETLLEENNLIISYEYENETTVYLSALGQPLEISFSMARTDKQESLGILNFARINGVEKRESVWTLYFNRNGNSHFMLNGSKNTYNLSDKESIRKIFDHLLVMYASKDSFLYPDDNEIYHNRKFS
jgi:hypothetical protein